DQVVLLAAVSSLNDGQYYILVYVKFMLGYDNGLGTASNAAVDSNPAGVPAHYLHNAASFVGISCVTDLVYGIKYSIHGRIVSDGIIGAGDIIVYGSWYAYHLHPL